MPHHLLGLTIDDEPASANFRDHYYFVLNATQQYRMSAITSYKGISNDFNMYVAQQPSARFPITICGGSTAGQWQPSDQVKGCGRTENAPKALSANFSWGEVGSGFVDLFAGSVRHPPSLGLLALLTGVQMQVSRLCKLYRPPSST